MKSFEYFGYGLEDAYGFGISLIDDIDDGFLWRVHTDHGEACLKRFRSAIEVENSTAACIYLHDRGFTRTPRVIPTAEGKLYIRSPITDPVWWLALFEWVPGEGGEAASTLWERQDQIDSSDDECGEVAADFAHTLARFHEASRGFRPWPTDRDAEFWVWNFQRIRSQVEQVRQRLLDEERDAVRRLLEESLEECRPILDASIRRAEESFQLFRSVISLARERQEVRHCDMHAGNFLLGSDGLMIMDLSEIEPGPRIYKDTRNLWDFWADEKTAVLATTTYLDSARLSMEEVDLLPIINDPIDYWRELMDGYLSGDWTEVMLTNYRGNVTHYGKQKERLELVTAVLRERVQ